MPNLDGFGLLEWIRSDERLRDMPVIMLTSHEDIASMDRAHALGASSFANKPVNWRLVSYLIRQVWLTRRLQEEVAALRAQLAQRVA
jgi:PleD family two-component response regulator